MAKLASSAHLHPSPSSFAYPLDTTSRAALANADDEALRTHSHVRSTTFVGRTHHSLYPEIARLERLILCIRADLVPPLYVSVGSPKWLRVVRKSQARVRRCSVFMAKWPATIAAMSYRVLEIPRTARSRPLYEEGPFSPTA
jgi:hypothetical protein